MINTINACNDIIIGFVPNPTPWDKQKLNYTWVEEFASLRGQVKGN